MLNNPYATSVGLLTPTDKLKFALTEYLIKSGDSNLNYEYNADTDVNLVFITGKNQMEIDLPVWSHPLIFKDHKDNVQLCVDLRPVVKITDSDFSTLATIIRDVPVFEYNIVRVLYIAGSYGDELGIIRPIETSVVMGFANWVSTMITTAMFLDVEENIKLNIVLLHYYHALITDRTLDSGDMQSIAYKMIKASLAF